jgi:protein SCO1/2
MQNFYKIILSVSLISVLLGGACETADSSKTDPAAVKRYPLKGKVVSVDKEKKTAKVDHEAIPDFMPAMTMDFPIHEDWVWGDLAPGAEIRAELVVDNTAKEPYWLEKVGIIAASLPGQSLPPVEEQFPQVGKVVPDLKLTNQDGERFSLKDYRGKALAITFIYAQCPLPEYCIKMSRNFSDLANELATHEIGKDEIRLLSISFDPARDTPEKLKQYGLGYLGSEAKDDLTVWQLAVGSDAEVRAIADFFGLRYEVDANDKTQINHSLRTAVIAPDGTVTKIFSGNQWTNKELMYALLAAREKKEQGAAAPTKPLREP